MAKISQLDVRKPVGGRPTKYAPEVITKLKAAFANSFTVEQACYYAEITKDTYYNWIKRNPQFSDEMDRASHQPMMKAKQVVVGSINSGDVESAKWWLKNKAPDEFGGQIPESVGIHFHMHQGDQKQKYEL